MTSLQFCVEESTPATNVTLLLPLVRSCVSAQRRSGRCVGSARAENVLEGQLVETHEAEALPAEVGAGVEVLIGGAVGQKILISLALGQRGLPDLADAGSGEGALYLGVRPE